MRCGSERHKQGPTDEKMNAEKEGDCSAYLGWLRKDWCVQIAMEFFKENADAKRSLRQELLAGGDVL